LNPRQRRGVMLMVAAALAAIVLFFVAVNYVGGVNSQVAPKTTVYRATSEIAAYSVIKEDQLEAVEVPKRWTSPEAAEGIDDLVGRRVSYNIAEGTYLGNDMLLPVSALNENEREIALTVDSKTGIAGRVRSGDFVDVYAVFDGESGGSSQVLVRNVRVVSVSGSESRSETTNRDEITQREVTPVTLALEPDDALAVTYADAFALTVRLVGLPPDIGEEDRSREPSKLDGSDLGLPGGGS